MKRSLILLFYLSVITNFCQAQSTLSLVNSIRLTPASIWGGVSFNGENMRATAISAQNNKPQLFFKANKDGQRVGNIAPVIEKTANRTNDMFLMTDGDFIHAGYYRPPAQTVFHRFDQNLHVIGTPVATEATQPHNNIGSIVFKENLFEWKSFFYFKAGRRQSLYTRFDGHHSARECAGNQYCE